MRTRLVGGTKLPSNQPTYQTTIKPAYITKNKLKATNAAILYSSTWRVLIKNNNRNSRLGKRVALPMNPTPFYRGELKFYPLIRKRVTPHSYRGLYYG